MVAMLRDVSVADALQAVYDAHKAGEISTTDIVNFIRHLFHETEYPVVFEVLSTLLAEYAREFNVGTADTIR
jgi:hypothetical protein